MIHRKKEVRLKARVSVVIPNYNGKDYLENCIDSVMQQDVRAFEIIVIDDASTDDSFELIKKKYPDNGAYPVTRYIKHDVNEGFCKSVNDGIKAASSEYILLLNNDTTVYESFVREMYNAIKRSDRIFSVSAKMVSMKNPEIMDDAGDYFSAFGWAYSSARDRSADNYNTRRRVFSACGGAAIYRKSILDEIGYFDENHFAYLEDVDIGYRARLHGYINMYEPKAVVMHAGSATSGSRYNKFKARLTAKNSVYVVYKNMPLWQKIVNMPFLILGFGIKTMFYIVKGHGGSYIKGLFDGIKLSKSSEGRCNKQDFSRIKFKDQLIIECELLFNILRRVIGM